MFPSVTLPINLSTVEGHCVVGLIFLPVPGHTDEPVPGDGVVLGHHEVVAVRQVAHRGRALQQPRAALGHLAARQAVVPLDLSSRGVRTERIGLCCQFRGSQGGS